MNRLLRFFPLAALMTCLLAVSAQAADYTVDEGSKSEYYPSTEYAETYGAEYRYGGTNAVDFAVPALPFGVQDGTQIGPMEKVQTPGIVPMGNAAVSDGSAVWYPGTATIERPVYTSAAALTRADGSIGTLSVPSLAICYKTYDSATTSNMNKGIAHFSDTSAWDGNIGLCGHNRGSRYNIGAIKDLSIGDTIRYTTALGTRTYKVSYVGTVSATDWSRLSATADNRITIITCLANRPNLRVCVQAVQEE